MTRYELLDRIGVGGMAEIFRGKAVAAGGFEKPVAIKRILPHLSQDQRFVQLLMAEAKVLSLLKHRNIVQIFDVGLGDDGQYFLVMEYVDGKDLGGVQRELESGRRRVPYDLVLHIGAEICEALEHAHASRTPDGRPMRLVHRDVSPSNVILSRAGEVKLTDFGLAKRADSETTRGSAVRGKFAYISPEQARNEHVDPRSDVFSVGILLWELFTSRRLFSGLGDLEALRGVRDAQIAPPTTADPRLPKAIDAIVMTALAREPARRYASAGALGAELRAMRYALDVTVGDPAGELARMVEAMMVPIAPSGPNAFDGNEATVIRLQPAAGFDGASGLAAARAVIDRFEDEETRLAQLSDDQLRALRSAAPARGPADDEETRARAPLDPLELDTPNAHVPPDDETRLVVPARARSGTPGAHRLSRPGTGSERRTPTPGDLGRQWSPQPTSSTNNREAPLTLDSGPQSPPSASGHSASGHSASGHSASGHSASEHSVSGHSASGHSASGHSASGHSVSGHSVSGHSVSAPSISRPPPMTLDGSTPPSLSEPLVPPPSIAPRTPPPVMAPMIPAPPTPPAMQLPVPGMPMGPAPTPPAIAPPAMAPPPGFGAWGPPAAAQPPHAPTPPVVPASRPSMPASRPSMPASRPSMPASRPSARALPQRPAAARAIPTWLLAIGAVIVALVAFAITRAFIR